MAQSLAACGYGVVLLAMGLGTLMGGAVMLCLALTSWLFGLPARVLFGRPSQESGRRE